MNKILTKETIDSAQQTKATMRLSIITLRCVSQTQRTRYTQTHTDKYTEDTIGTDTGFVAETLRGWKQNYTQLVMLDKTLAMSRYPYEQVVWKMDRKMARKKVRKIVRKMV